MMKKIFKKIIVGILLFESRLVLWRYKPKVVAVTGSVGKTSTKDAIYTVLAPSFSTRKSQKSYNSEIGVPLTILDLPNAWNNPFKWFLNILAGARKIIFTFHYPEVLVLEVGVGEPGDMKRITNFVKPDIVVFTKLAKVPVHVENFGSPEAVYREKVKLAQALKPGGTFILCGDDSRSMDFRDEIERTNITYGFEEEVNRVLGSNPEILYDERLSGLSVPAGILFRVDEGSMSLPVRLYGTLGRGHIYSALAAMATGIALEENVVELAKRIKHYSAPVGRMRILEGIKNSTIIDDSYNSSPLAVSSLFETMEIVETSGKKIAVLGDMLELGKYSEKEHKKVGKYVAGIFDLLVTIGRRAEKIAEGALNEGMSEKKILQFEDSHQAGLFLKNLIERGDVICVKGSQGSGEDMIRTERAILEIMAHPEKRENLLVRQEGAWSRH